MLSPVSFARRRELTIRSFCRDNRITIPTPSIWIAVSQLFNEIREQNTVTFLKTHLLTQLFLNFLVASQSGLEFASGALN